MGLHTVEPKTNGLHRLLWLVLGLVFTGIGIVGIIIPGLPTTIFMILAVVPPGTYIDKSKRVTQQTQHKTPTRIRYNS